MVLGSDVPALDIDAAMLKDFGYQLHPRNKLERRVVWALCQHLAERGYQIVAVHDYEERTNVKDAKEALELVFNLDGCNLHFKHKDEKKERCVVLVLGNGVDVVSDWWMQPGDAFDAAMEAFKPERCE